MDKTHSIFIVEDEQKVAALLHDYLHNAGYEVTIRETGDEAVERILSARPDLVILDLMLPVNDGLSICRELRKASDVPIMMITARIDEIDRLLGLELGADDYICKPFSPREVVVRVRNILRRVSQLNSESQSAMTTNLLTYRELTLDQSKMECRVSEAKVILTLVEFRILFEMTKRPGHIFSRQQLMDIAYDDGRVVSDRTVDTHIKNIRRKISEALDKELIHSIYGAGYKVE